MLPFAVASGVILGSAEGSGETMMGFQTMHVLIAAGTLLGACVLYSIINWKCPSCKKSLGKAFSPKFCQSCGTELQ